MRTDTSPHVRRPRPLAAAAVAFVLVAGLAACGDDDPDDLVGDTADTADTQDTQGTTASESDAPATTSGGDDAATDGADGDGPMVIAEDFTFDAPPVPAGTEVTFSNEDSAPHTVTADDGTFDSGSVDAGGSATFVAPSEPGDYAFHCEIHPEMQATLTVEA